MARISSKSKKNKNIPQSEKIGKENCKYQTIASKNKDYEDSCVMNEYDNLTDARSNYSKDMKEWKENEDHNDYHHFCIKEVTN